MNRGFLIGAAVAACGIIAPMSSAAERLVGVTWSGNLVELDPATASPLSVIDLDRTRYNGLDRSRRGTLYASSRIDNNSDADAIYEIDPVTGASTLVTETDSDLRAIATHPNGDIFGTVFTPNDGDISYSLLRINPITGNTVNIGGIRIVDVAAIQSQSLAFGPDGMLYGWQLNFGLVSINPVTAEATLIGGSANGIHLQSIAFNSAGQLFGVSAANVFAPEFEDSLFEIDTTTGDVSFIGQYASSSLDASNDIRGIEFIPAPGTAALGVIGSLGLVRRRRATSS